MSNVTQAAYVSTDRARHDGVKLLAEILAVPHVEIARRALDRILYEHREILLAHLEEHYAERADELRRLLERSVKEVTASDRGAIAA